MRVAELWRYPVKSLRGEPLRAAEIDRGGIAGDRAVHVVDERGELVTAHTRPNMLLLQATLAPDGAIAWMGRDRRRFRPNLVIEGVDGLAERGWPRARLRVGDALLDVRWICKRCVITTLDPDTATADPDVLRRINGELDGLFALNCDVAESGRVAVGDPVALA